MKFYYNDYFYIMMLVSTIKKGILLCTMVNSARRVVNGTKTLMMGGGRDQRLYSYFYNHRLYKKQSISKTN